MKKFFVLCLLLAVLSAIISSSGCVKKRSSEDAWRIEEPVEDLCMIIKIEDIQGTVLKRAVCERESGFEISGLIVDNRNYKIGQKVRRAWIVGQIAQCGTTANIPIIKP